MNFKFNARNDVSRMDLNDWMGRYLRRWIYAALIVAAVVLLADILGFQFHKSLPYELFSILLPGTKSLLLPIDSRNASIASALWIYNCYSLPATAWFALRSTTHCRLDPKLTTKLTVFAIMISVAIAGISMIYFGKFYNDESGSIYFMLYRSAIIGAVGVPVVIGLGTISGFIYTLAYIREIWRRAAREI